MKEVGSLKQTLEARMTAENINCNVCIEELTKAVARLTKEVVCLIEENINCNVHIDALTRQLEIVQDEFTMNYGLAMTFKVNTSSNKRNMFN
jgi:hypothetical protein